MAVGTGHECVPTPDTNARIESLKQLSVYGLTNLLSILVTDPDFFQATLHNYIFGCGFYPVNMFFCCTFKALYWIYSPQISDIPNI